MYLSRDAHGPAVTLTIKDSNVGYDINVDISATIDESPVPVSVYCWPRALSTIDEEKAKKVLALGTHLVPKHEELWKTSFSKAEKSYLHNIDRDNECRRKCHQLMKKDFEQMKSASTHGYPGISTHVLRVRLSFFKYHI